MRTASSAQESKTDFHHEAREAEAPKARKRAPGEQTTGEQWVGVPNAVLGRVLAAKKIGEESTAKSSSAESSKARAPLAKWAFVKTFEEERGHPEGYAANFKQLTLLSKEYRFSTWEYRQILKVEKRSNALQSNRHQPRHHHLAKEAPLPKGGGKVRLPRRALKLPAKIVTFAAATLLCRKPRRPAVFAACMGIVDNRTANKLAIATAKAGLIELHRGPKGLLFVGRPGADFAKAIEEHERLRGQMSKNHQSKNRQSKNRQTHSTCKEGTTSEGQAVFTKTEREAKTPLPPASGGRGEAAPSAFSEGKRRAAPSDTARAQRPARAPRGYQWNDDGGMIFGPRAKFPAIAKKTITWTTGNTALASAQAIWPGVKPTHIEQAFVEISTCFKARTKRHEDVPIGEIIKKAAERAALSAAIALHGTPEKQAGGPAGELAGSKYTSRWCVLSQAYFDRMAATYADGIKAANGGELERKFASIVDGAVKATYGTALQADVEQQFENYVAKLDAEAKKEKAESARQEAETERDRERLRQESREAYRLAVEKAKETAAAEAEAAERAALETEEGRELARIVNEARARLAREEASPPLSPSQLASVLARRSEQLEQDWHERVHRGGRR